MYRQLPKFGIDIFLKTFNEFNMLNTYSERYIKENLIINVRMFTVNNTKLFNDRKVYIIFYR